ncbi:acyl carrier protein [Paenibacillus sp. SC116]|uniref:acyl carrier protein n=1 Tax=Paenibacillus sp. SC116 TaxID=2968986 RepID=UPI00215AB8A8|nr:acyl carrier protein [Paenibacillus sp. SC116]MCR8842152.1 acyl carrier protein [Paenibacillus sp. SC116]
MDLSQQIRELILEVTKLEQDTPFSHDFPLSELGLHSMRVVELIVKLETAFDIEISDDVTVEDFKTLQHITSLVEGILNE